MIRFLWGQKGKGGSCLTGSNSNGLDFHSYLNYGFMTVYDLWHIISYDLSELIVYLYGFMMIYDYDNYNI